MEESREGKKDLMLVKREIFGTCATIRSSVPGESAHLVWRRVSHPHRFVQRTETCRSHSIQQHNTGHCRSVCSFEVGLGQKLMFSFFLLQSFCDKDLLYSAQAVKNCSLVIEGHSEKLDLGTQNYDTKCKRKNATVLFFLPIFLAKPIIIIQLGNFFINCG